MDLVVVYIPKRRVLTTYKDDCVPGGELQNIGTRHNPRAGALHGSLGGVDRIVRRLAEAVTERLPFRVRSIQKQGAVASLKSHNTTNNSSTQNPDRQFQSQRITKTALLVPSNVRAPGFYEDLYDRSDIARMPASTHPNKTVMK